MYKEIAEREGMPLYITHNVYYHFFKLLKEFMANSRGETIHIQDFAKFKPSKRVVAAIIKVYERNPEKHEEALKELKEIEKRL